MNPSSYVSVGAGTSLLAEVLMYFTHWPLQPLTEAQASAFAGVIILIAGSCHGLVNALWPKTPAGSVTVTTGATEQTVVMPSPIITPTTSSSGSGASHA